MAALLVRGRAPRAVTYRVTLREAGTRRWVYTHFVSYAAAWPPTPVRDEREAGQIALERELRVWGSIALADHSRRPRGGVYVHRVDVLEAEPVLDCAVQGLYASEPAAERS